MEKFKVIKISGVAVGVGFEKKVAGGVYSEKICETLFVTGDDKKDAEEAAKWAKIICDALNEKHEK